MTYEYEGVTYYFIDNLVYFGGSKPYGDFRTDIEKFAFFDKAVLSILPIVGFRPDLIHCHDWQTGLIPVYLKTEFAAGEFYRGIKSVMTIHNLRFQGIWDVETMQGLTGLPDYVFTPDKLEYKRDANMLKGKETNVRSITMATMFVTIIPIIIVYPFLQRYFVKGIMIGSVKG